jgi:hypothetical protein
MRKFTFKKPESVNSVTTTNVAVQPLENNNVNSAQSPEKVAPPPAPNYVLTKNEQLIAKSMIPFSVVNKKKSPNNKNYKNKNSDEGDETASHSKTKKTSPHKSSQSSRTKQTNLTEFMKKPDNGQFKPVSKNSNNKTDECEKTLLEFTKNVEDDDDKDYIDFKKKGTKPTHQSTQIPIDVPPQNQAKSDQKVKAPSLHKLQISPIDLNEKSNTNSIKRSVASVKSPK